MGGRYLVTGVQLGMLKAQMNLNGSKDAEAQIQKILEEQFVGSSDQAIEIDVKKTSNILFGKES